MVSSRFLDVMQRGFGRHRAFIIIISVMHIFSGRRKVILILCCTFLSSAVLELNIESTNFKVTRVLELSECATTRNFLVFEGGLRDARREAPSPLIVSDGHKMPHL